MISSGHDIQKYKDYFNNKFKKDEPEQKENLSVVLKSANNVVSGEKLRKIQSETLASTKDFLSNTFGPMGSILKLSAEIIENLYLLHILRMD